MEERGFDEVLDDWFIESLKTYKDLHVYQLEHPTRVIEWTSGKTVCVSGYASSKSDILELRLPLKLFADENKGLCAERDFKVVNGGLTDGPVRCLRHVPGTRCVVTNDGRSSDLQVWDLGGDDSGQNVLPLGDLRYSRSPNVFCPPGLLVPEPALFKTAGFARGSERLTTAGRTERQGC